MQQLRMFRLAPEAIVVSAHFTPREGWTASVQMRRQDELWSEVQPSVYGCLTTSELYDVLCAELERQLGL